MKLLTAYPQVSASNPQLCYFRSRWFQARGERISSLMYLLWRFLAPRLPTQLLRDWAWQRKWRFWHALYGPHQSLWVAE